MNQHSRIENLLNSKLYPLLLFLISFVFVVLFSRSTSFLYVFEGADPSIFKQMGRAILKGKIVYIDYFDNKGCLLYFIHALGLWLGGDFALMLMQVVSLTVTLFIWDKMLVLYRMEKERMIILCIALLMLLCFYGAGDQTQEWCLPFISYPLLVYFRAYKSKTEIRPLQMLFIGICFGVITFIQINNACAFLGFLAYLWILYLIKKDYKKLLQNIGCFIAGWLIIAVPCVLYFYVKAGGLGVYEMVYASFLSNFEYMGVQHLPKWFHWLPYALFLLSFITLNIINLHKQKDILIPFLISILLFIATFGKRSNGFYLISLLPLIVASMMVFNRRNRKPKILFGVLASVCSLFIGSIVFFHLMNDLILRREKEVTIYNDFHHIIEQIPTTERDSIFNYNLFWHGYGMMEHEELIQCNRVSLAFDLPSLMKEEVGHSLPKPVWIMISPEFKYYKEDASFILDNYELSFVLNYDRLFFKNPWVGNLFHVYFYRRRDAAP